jgi:hypothetical protein
MKLIGRWVIITEFNKFYNQQSSLIPDRHLIMYVTAVFEETQTLPVPAFKLVSYYKNYLENKLEQDKPFQKLKECLIKIYGSLE